MNKNSFKKILVSAGQLFVIGLLSLTVSCKDEPARISGDVLPEGELIGGFNYDGHLLATKNVARESVRTSDATFGIIGEFDDPVFGVSKASFLTDFSIGNKVDFKVNILDLTDPDTIITHKDYHFYKFDNNVDTVADTWKLDSLVLNLQYQFNNWYGDMLHEQNVNIYELSGSLGSITQDYFSDHDVSGMYFTTPIGKKVIHPNDEVPDSLKSSNWSNIWQYPDSLWNHPQYLWDNDKVKADKDSSWLDANFKGNTTTTKKWSFKLNQDVAQRFFDMSESDLKSTATFKDVFNGIYVALDDVSPSNGNGWLAKVDLLSSSAVTTNLTMHVSRDHLYMNSDSVINDTTSLYQYSFPINLENVRFNTYKHSLDIDIDDPDPNRLHIQGMAGSYMKMQLPQEVLDWTDSIKDPNDTDVFDHLEYKMVANIEFFMEVAMDSADIARYPIPSKLSIKWLDKDGELEDPFHRILVNGNEIVVPVFGGDADGQGNRYGTGERVARLNDNGDIEYLYRFVMRADYFNYIMREQDGAELDEKEFFIGPVNTTSNFQRVILYSGSKSNEEVEEGGSKKDKRMKMNIKYYKYNPR